MVERLFWFKWAYVCGDEFSDVEAEVEDELSPIAESTGDDD